MCQGKESPRPALEANGVAMRHTLHVMSCMSWRENNYAAVGNRRMMGDIPHCEWRVRCILIGRGVTTPNPKGLGFSGRNPGCVAPQPECDCV
jgi:hypothetical protein